ncbi:glomulin [Belonocnema kinseyi]|uniref:glomulin n=1 Tax=Belonocnema kinseyi TaxID=2817044 RepID=UPI00143DAF97|nr:glomulin [Belonocnema kinseyi]
MSSKMSSLESPVSFEQQIKVLLLGEDPTKAVDLATNENHLQLLKDSSWNIVQIISPHLTIENAEGNVRLFKTCENLLQIIAEKCQPSEIVLELLEQMDNFENDVKFCALLSPLKVSLNRMDDKSRAFDWCVNTIKSYLESIPCDKSRIIDLYKEIMEFLKPLIAEASLGKESNIRDLLLSLLISILGKPFCFLEKESISESIINSICQLTGDCFRFLTIIAEREKRRKKSPEASNLFESTWQISDLSYANFYYLVIISFPEKVPQIYDSEFILHNCFFIACTFLQNQEIVLVSKGLNLVEAAMSRVEKYSLGQRSLDSTVHSKLFACITQVMIYCEIEKQRQKALEIFRNYIDLFEMQTRYQVISQLLKITNHSGLLSIITAIVKDSVIKCLEDNPPSTYFLGRKLQNLLSLVCRLAHGSTTDLIEIAEEIIAALNLIRFLAIRDKDNLTGFWDYAEELERNYLKNLRTGIDLSRAHWKLKVKDLQLELEMSRKMKKRMDNGDNVMITVGGEDLGMLPVSEKIRFSNQALNALDIMENVLIRVNECFEDRRIKSA